MEEMMRQALGEYFGYDSFRPGQEQVISAILSGRDVLTVMPTGGGKSICYQLPAVMADGITLVISPLISLMQDQVRSLIQTGIRAAYLNSTLTPAQQSLALRRASQGAYQIIYVAPERLSLPSFRAFAQRAPIVFITVDEAHCISQWGHDFRPSYLEIADFLACLPRRPVVAAFTATATEAVRRDIVRSLALRSPEVFVSGFDRPNLYFETQEPKNRDQAVLDAIARFPERSGIVYCLTRKKVEELCDILGQNGVQATRYHAGLSPEERRNNQEDFLYDRKRVMVATNAFGMGIDKPNVGFVIHCGLPSNPESYYQEAGRAGRDGAPAQCILLFLRRDIQVNRYFIENKGEENAGLTPEQLAAQQQADTRRLQQMVDYATTPRCLRQSLLSYFGEKAPGQCGNCSNCLNGQAPEDMTALGREIVLCVAELAREGRAFGMLALVSILTGTAGDTLYWLHPEHLDCYGKCAAIPPRKLKQAVQAMTDQGFLARSAGEKQVLELTLKATELVSGKEHLLLKPRTRKKPLPRPAVSDAPPDAALFDRLRETRAALAKRDGVPAFMVFSDAVLKEMCRLLPRSREELMQVKGVGTHKANRYGEVFLRVLNQR